MIRWKRNVFNRIFNVALGLFLSGTIKMRQMKSNLGELTIVKDRDLDCDFTARCKWFSERGSADQEARSRGQLSPWNVAQGTPDPIVWFAATATNRQPRSPFGYLALQRGSGEALTSAILPCQQGSGLLTFEYWLSSSASGFVCVLSADSGAQIHCSHPLQRSPGHATIKILGPILKPFKLAIIGTGQGFIIVDNIRYSGDVQSPCPDLSLLALSPPTTTFEPEAEAPPLQLERSEEATGTASLLGPGVSHWDYEDRRNHTFLESADDLTCDFESFEFTCRWGPKDGTWSLVDGQTDPQLLKALLATDTSPAFPAVALTDSTTSIVSDPIVCQKNDAQIILNWWATPNVTLKVCATSFPQVYFPCRQTQRYMGTSKGAGQG